MKFLKNSIFAALALAMLAGSTSAQTYTPTGDKKLLIARGYITPTTVVADRLVQQPDADIYVNTRCGTAVSVTLLQKLADGTVLNSTSYPCDTTPRTVSFTAPQWFEALAISPTTTVSTTGVSSTIIEAKK